IDRRAFIAYFSGAGLATTLLPGALWTQVASAQSTEITPEMVEAAAKIAGLDFTQEEREQIAKGLARNISQFEALRENPIPNDVPPAIQFNPLPPSFSPPSQQGTVEFSSPNESKRPRNLDALAHWSLIDLAGLIKSKKITARELTEMYIARLKRHTPELHCVITLTEERALRQADEADKEIASGKYRGPLHGIPWGAKDLLAVKGYPTTWGATPYKDQTFDYDATVVQRLDEAGAILVAKLSLGALAQNDIWFGERTRNPWDTERGSSGSSAGPASATSAGLVAFSIGSETNGSIMSPATTCGVTGLRPTFGRVSRHGAMALSWTMDKIGPICRTAEDCAIVLDAIHGQDDNDSTTLDAAFNWNPSLDPTKLRVGYLKDAFREDTKNRHNQASLDVLRAQGIDLKPVSLPDFDFQSLSFILTTESAAAFDELTRNNRDDELIKSNWPNAFRTARFVPAVEYIQANRARTLLIREMAETMTDIDLFVTPSRQNLMLGNLTGHPLICVPDGFTDPGLPTSIGFFGKLYGDSEIMAVAKHFQDNTDHHLQYPPGFS
ncbi:MAG: amidase, partial [Candidatus Hydrogenedentota bacterium]